MRITVCKDCEDREIGCHGKCERYIKERDAREELMAMAKKEKALYYDYVGVKAASAKKARKKRGEKW